MRNLLVGLLLFGLGAGGAVLATQPASAQSQAVAGTLTGSVGSAGSPNAYVISLSADSVPGPGTYQFDITDYAAVHNFDLLSPNGVSVDKTSVAGTGTVTWTVALSPGVYTYQCDVHSYAMSGTLTVPSSTTTSTTGTTATTTTPPPTTTTPTTTAATTTTGTTTPTPTRRSRALRVHIVSAQGTSHSVVVKVSSSKRGKAVFQLLEGTKRLVKVSHAVPGKLTLKPAHALAPGSYVVRVTLTAGGKTAGARRTVRVR